MDEQETPAQPGTASNVAMTLIIKALQVLSQRTVIALASLFDLALCGSVFYLALQVMATPTNLQLIELGGYAVFVLFVLFSRRRN